MEREQRPADETHEQGMRGKEVALMSTNIRQASNDSTARVAGKVALIRAETELETDLDAYKLRLGLPPEIPVRLDDSLLEPFIQSLYFGLGLL